MLCSGGAARRACCGALPAAPVAPPNCLPPRAAVLAACIRRERAPGGCLHSRSSAARRARRHRAAVVAIAGAAAAAPAQKPCPTTTPAQLLASRRVLSAPVMLSAPAEGEQSIFGFVDVRDIVSSFFKAGGCLQRTCCKQHACWLPTACTLAANSMHTGCNQHARRIQCVLEAGSDFTASVCSHECPLPLRNCRAAGRGPGIDEDAAAHATAWTHLQHDSYKPPLANCLCHSQSCRAWTWHL